MRRSTATIANAPMRYREGIKIMNDIYNDDEYVLEEAGDPGLLRIKEVLKVTVADFILDRSDARREKKYEALLARPEPRGSTAEWIEFVKDKKRRILDEFTW